jgi:hypothetical protein
MQSVPDITEWRLEQQGTSPRMSSMNVALRGNL